MIKFVTLELKDFPSPRSHDKRRRSQFKASWDKTLKLLEKELYNLAATQIVIQAGFAASQIRQDGWPYGKAAPAHPAVILSFREAMESSGTPLSFPCDTFVTHTENIRAIALSLEALRAVDRFGVTKLGEQYAGFKQIEAARPWTVEEAAQFLGIKCGAIPEALIRDEAAYRRAYRAAAAALHPDAGGNPHEWNLLADAKKLLDAHHGLSSNAGAS
jgi:hypothetical protein